MNAYIVGSVSILLTPLVVVLWARLEKRNFALWGSACALAIALAGILVTLYYLVSSKASLGASLIDLTTIEWIETTFLFLVVAFGVITTNGIFFAGLVALILLGVSITARLNSPHKISSIAVFAAGTVVMMRHMWITVPLISDEDIVANLKQNHKSFVELVELHRAKVRNTKEIGLLKRRLAVASVSQEAYCQNVDRSEKGAETANELKRLPLSEAHNNFLPLRIALSNSNYERNLSIRYRSVRKTLIAFPSPPKISNGAVLCTDAQGPPDKLARVLDSLNRYPHAQDPSNDYATECALRKIDGTWFIQLCFEN